MHGNLGPRGSQPNAKAKRIHFDLILVDGFDAKGRAGKLHTVPFYRLCRGGGLTTAE
jgi:spermidine synthase